MRVVATPQVLPVDQAILCGTCWVIDGDTIVIDKSHIRLAGIDAPELDHPWGVKAKWELVRLCKGQRITAHIKPELSYDRLVAQCFLPDGRDLAAEMVRAGMALDWPKFSAGKYRDLEQPDARKKLWRAAIRQRGGWYANGADIPGPPAAIIVRKEPEPYVPPYKAQHNGQVFDGRWLIVPGFLLLLVVAFFVNSAGTTPSPSTAPRAPTPSARPLPLPAPAQVLRFEVVADALNVRAEPVAGADIIGRLERGAVIRANRFSRSWVGIALDDGREGWVHGFYLRAMDD